MNKPKTNGQQKEELASKGVQKIRTIIEGFDEITHGGLPIGRTTLVSGTSGTGKTLLARQVRCHGRNCVVYPGVFVSVDESREEIRHD
ncbi:MAG: ATPase domain-containing protein, partial [Prochloraceae cyanobacterium]